jgi:hypothetical protein
MFGRNCRYGVHWLLARRLGRLAAAVVTPFISFFDEYANLCHDLVACLVDPRVAAVVLLLK